jgi:hypothetical protein
MKSRGDHRMLIDAKGKLFGKVSVIDLFIVLFIVATLGGAYYKFFIAGKNAGGGSFGTIQYQVKVKNIRQPSVKAIQESTEVFEDKTDNYIGKIVNVEVEQAEGTIMKPDGTYIKAAMPERYSATVTIEAPGIETDVAYIVNGSTEIKRGSELLVRSKLITFSSEVYDVKMIEAE